MSYRNRNGRARLGEFRPSALTQTPESSLLRRIPVSSYDERPRRSAREWSLVNVPRLLGSRPVMWADHPHLKDGRGKPLQVPSYGPPSFRNVIDPQTGAHI